MDRIQALLRGVFENTGTILWHRLTVNFVVEHLPTMLEFFLTTYVKELHKDWFLVSSTKIVLLWQDWHVNKQSRQIEQQINGECFRSKRYNKQAKWVEWHRVDF